MCINFINDCQGHHPHLRKQNGTYANEVGRPYTVLNDLVNHEVLHGETLSTSCLLGFKIICVNSTCLGQNYIFRVSSRNINYIFIYLLLIYKIYIIFSTGYPKYNVFQVAKPL